MYLHKPFGPDSTLSKLWIWIKICQMKKQTEHVLSMMSLLVWQPTYTVGQKERYSRVDVFELKPLCSSRLATMGSALPSAGGHHTASCPELPTLHT